MKKIDVDWHTADLQSISFNLNEVSISIQSIVMAKKNALGRGLDALITFNEGESQGSTSINEVELSKISPNPDQPRRVFDEESLEELAVSIQKIGLSLRDDFNAIQKRSKLEPKGFLDLQNYVGKYGIKDASLQKIYAIIFNKKISKGQRLSNWEADILSPLAVEMYSAVSFMYSITLKFSSIWKLLWQK